MNQLKYSLGPFEVFSSFISGLPLLLSFYILYNREFSLARFNSTILMNSSFADLLLLTLISYVLGALISGISYPYFKFMGKLLGRDFLYFEKQILRNWDKLIRRVTLEKFLSFKF